MKTMAKSILEEAMEDAKVLKETAVENAKNILVEAFSDEIKNFVNSQLNEGDKTIKEMPEALAHLSPEELEQLLMMLKGGHAEMGMQPGPEAGPDEGGDGLGDMLGLGHEEEEDEDMLQAGMYEGGADGGATDVPSFTMPPVTETEDEEEDTMEENQESVEITNEDLAAALRDVIRETHAYQSGPNVAPGFADAENPNKNAKGGLGEKSAPGERGLEDKEKEQMWKDHEPPAGADWTVKEHAYNKTIEVLRNQIATLKNENNELTEACQFLKRNLTEVNLFNTKLIYTQRLVQEVGGNISKKQREGIVESIDRAESLREVELIYKSLSESLKIAGVLGESRQMKTSPKGPKNSRFTTPSSTMLKEALNREDGQDDWATSQQRLAGLLG